MVIMFIFVFITGASFSAVRAFVMVLLHQISILVRRRYDLWNALGFVSLLSILYNPFVVWNVGFQLSFWAVFSIGFYSKIRAISIRSKYADNLSKWEIVLFPLTVQLALTPIMIFQFNRVHIYSLFFNIPVAILMPPVFAIGLLSIPLSSLPIVGSIVSFLCVSLLESLRSLSHIVLRLPLSNILVGSPKGDAIAFFYFVLAVFGLSLRFRKRLKRLLKEQVVLILSVCIALGLFASFVPSKDGIIIDFLDVGQGDAGLVHGESGGHVLIDAGPEKADLTDILLKQGITNLDAVFLSHPDSDHYFGFVEMAGNIKVKTFYYGLIREKKDVLEELKRIYPNTDFVQLAEGDRLTWQGVTFDVLHPKDSVSEVRGGLSCNDLSLTLLMQYKNKKVLFTGDIEKSIEKDIVERYESLCNVIDVDILKVAHHGSNTSTTEAFIDLVDPEYAVIQVGKNFFGHPTETTLNTLQKNGIEVYRNDRQGCVRVIIDENIEIIPWLTLRH